MLSLISKLLSLFAACVLACLFSCTTSNHSNAGVTSAMKYYDHLILKLDADSIALLYTPDGNLGSIATGRDSIRKFLSSFKNVRVLSQASTTTSIKIIRDTAIQNGSYTQSDIVSGHDTVNVKGTYMARWQWIKKEGWHIKQMTTKPTN
jgi:hypothetical protein